MTEFAAQLTEVVNHYKSAKHVHGKHVELECRFGLVKDDNHFESRISKQQAQQLIRSFCESKTMHSSNYWQEIHDYYFYASPSDSVPIRCSSIANTNTLNIESTNIKKQRLHIVHCKTNTYLDTRTALSIESPVRDQDMPIITKPHAVCIKQRRVFTYKSSNEQYECTWMYCVTKRWTGASKTAAEQLRMTEEPKYELEIELQQCDNGIPTDYIVKSLYMKILDIHKITSSLLKVDTSQC